MLNYALYLIFSVDQVKLLIMNLSNLHYTV